MTLLHLPAGSRFRLPEAPDLGTAVLIDVSESRAIVRWDRPAEYVHYETAVGRTVEFYRAARNESITSDEKSGRQFDELLARFPWESFKEFDEPLNKANARLIAAAPDLLAICQYINEDHDAIVHLSDHLRDMLEAAIAKAKATP